MSEDAISPTSGELELLNDTTCAGDTAELLVNTPATDALVNTPAVDALVNTPAVEIGTTTTTTTSTTINTNTAQTPKTTGTSQPSDCSENESETNKPLDSTSTTQAGAESETSSQNDSITNVSLLTKSDCSQENKNDNGKETVKTDISSTDIEDEKESKTEVPQSLDLGATASSSQCADKDTPPSIYQVKRIKFGGETVSLITQNENGPCPLLAIINWLSLKGKVKIPLSSDVITSEQLMEYLGDCVFNQVPQNITEDSRLNFEQNVNDAMSIFHKLQTGLDVNVKFTGIKDFEYTPECILFDLLNISVYHGWLVDPGSPETVSAVGACSYNQLVEKIITQKSSTNMDQVTETLVAEQFLEGTAAQLTYHGLCELSSGVGEEELCVLFRNNHFSTLYKHKNELFLLVTDQGFLREPSVVWETLSNVEGDGNFVNADFKTYRKPEPLAPPADIILNSEQQINHDYLIACSLAQEEPEPVIDQQEVTSSGPVPSIPTAHCLSDHQLAMQLQDEENQAAVGGGSAAAGADTRRGTTPPSRSAAPPSRGKKSDDCSLL